MAKKNKSKNMFTILFFTVAMAVFICGIAYFKNKDSLEHNTNTYEECAKNYPEGVLVKGSDPPQYECTTPGGQVFIDNSEFIESFDNIQ